MLPHSLSARPQSKAVKQAHFTDAVWGGGITGTKAPTDQQRSPKPCAVQRAQLGQSCVQTELCERPQKALESLPFLNTLPALTLK